MVRLILSVCLLSFSLFAQAARDDVLILVNDNSIDSPQVGSYYAQRRDINPDNIAHLKVRPGFFMSWDQFKNMRDQIISFMQNRIKADNPGFTPVICNESPSPYYCDESMQQLRENTGFRYIVTTRGIPTRMRVEDPASELSTPNGPTSVDNYLKYWLLNYIPIDIALKFTERETDFGLNGSGMRLVDPAIDKELIVGRIDGINLEKAKALVDRAIAAEQTGIYGNIYTTNGSNNFNGNSWTYQYSIFNDVSEHCIGDAYNPSSFFSHDKESIDGRVPTDCLVRAVPTSDDSGSDTVPGDDRYRLPLVDDALVYLGYLDSQTTGAGDLDRFLNWRKNDACSVTLCEDAADVALCQASSIDPFKEINTECVGLADGFMGYNYRSYPLTYLTVWPTAWNMTQANKYYSRGAGEFNNAAFPEIRSDTGVDDNFSVWFSNNDSVNSPGCYSSSDFSVAADQPCDDIRDISFSQRVAFSARTVNIVSPQVYEVSYCYKSENITDTADFMLRLDTHEVTGGSEKVLVGTQSIGSFAMGDSDWNCESKQFEINPDVFIDDALNYNGLKIEFYTNGTLAGSVAMDNISLKEVGDDTELLVNGSFTEGHKNVGTGDYAANYLSRLNGVAFWGSVSHHQSGGHAFDSHESATLAYFMRGLPLGDSVWFNENNNSGLLYGDPLYSPVAIHINPVAGSNDRIEGAVDLYGSTANGTDLENISAQYTVSYCYGSSAITCDANDEWVSTGISGEGGLRNHLLGTWDVSNLLSGDYTLKLSVTTTNTEINKSQTYNDFYTVHNDVIAYSISGTVRSAEGRAMPNVEVAVNSQSGSIMETVTTDLNGKYRVGNLKNGVYLVYLTKSGFNFSANTGTGFQTIDGQNVINKDFTADAIAASISGRIVDNNGQPVSNIPVMINDNGAFQSTVYTNADGYYTQGGLANTLYIVMPTSTGYTYSYDTGNAFANVTGDDILDKNITANIVGNSIFGSVLTESGQPVSGIKVYIYSSSYPQQELYTNSNGFYRISNLENGTYVTSAIDLGYTFTKEGEVFINILDQDAAPQNFTATKKYTFNFRCN